MYSQDTNKEFVDWHTLDTEHALSQLDSSVDGLTNGDAKQRLRLSGPNALPEKRRRSLWVLMLGQFTDFMIIVLLAAALISGLVGEPQDTVVILVIIFLNAIIGGVQAFRADNAIAALREIAAPQAQIIRDGKTVTLPAKELVPGDVVLLEAGNVVPADLRLLEVEEMLADESALSGESHGVEKCSGQINKPLVSIGDRLNMAFMSSLITKGRGKGVVVATGLDTEIGRIASLLSSGESVKTPLQLRLRKFGRYLALVILSICAIVFSAGLLQGQPAMLMFMTAVSLAVAAIPEALPAVVSVSLAFGAGKLIRHQALIRNLPAVETLGSVTYICVDKTGTLTQNRMSAELFAVAGERYSALQEIASLPLQSALGQALALNNDVAEIDGIPSGEPTELALFEAATAGGFQKKALDLSYPRVAVVPFDSQRKQMTTLHKTREGHVAYIKGAPEAVLVQCQFEFREGIKTPVDRSAIQEEALQLASSGYRVLAVAMRDFTGAAEAPDKAIIEKDLTLLALVALIDPVRPEAPQAIADCFTAGITPVMITGDHPGTAQAIAERLGIDIDDSSTLSGDELAQLDDKAFARVVDSIRVYARVTPEQKLRIVKALQQRGEFVAMTGDGVNDAPALKRANIGVAMGRKGTDVAREASDMVLLDDNFATIVQAVRAGRRIFDNIRKFIKYTMSSNAGEVWTLFLAPLLGFPIPLLPIHILWINLVTDGLPGLALTAEQAEPGIMQRPPRKPQESIFADGMWQHILWVGLLIAGLSIIAMAWALSRNAPYWQTMVFTVLTVSQLFHVVAIRSERRSLFHSGFFSNLPLLGALVLTLLLQLAVIYTPALNDLFHTQPLPLFDLVVCLLLSSVVLVAVEIEKWFFRSVKNVAR